MGTERVDGGQGSQGADTDYNQEPDYDFDSGHTPPSGSTRPGTPQAKYSSAGTSPTRNYGAQPTSGGISPGGDFGMPSGSEQEVGQFVQDLKSQGYSNEQIQQAVSEQFGVSLSPYDVDYYANGSASSNDRGGNKYSAYPSGPMANKYSSFGGSSYLQQYLENQQLTNEAKESARSTRSQGRKEMVRMNMILLLIMMGDVTGALRAYTSMMDRDFRQFARGVMDKLGKVRQARARVIRNFASERPPRAYAGDNPQSAARAQDQAQRYTQYVQLSTQLMGELQTTERELVDILQTMKRDIDNFWQSYAGMRDAEGRVNERLMTTR
jgi:hypothetical protein